ncbi:hypothetical protein F2Q69_00027923 [Brassica cretica]|uniref:Uncharacterized protein n=1 Tax=Brassica cretica TaxID=69181 RepID=A0A8S9S7F9_BRACR|nr:hypothetical protein F2Q69_00027923 [Brassica cretica]
MSNHGWSGAKELRRSSMARRINESRNGLEEKNLRRNDTNRAGLRDSSQNFFSHESPETPLSIHQTTERKKKMR